MRAGDEAGVAAVPPWREALHALSQPLTRLQWRLEFGRMAKDEAAVREAVAGCLNDVREMTEQMGRMRALLSEMQTQKEQAR